MVVCLAESTAARFAEDNVILSLSKDGHAKQVQP